MSQNNSLRRIVLHHLLTLGTDQTYNKHPQMTPTDLDNLSIENKNATESTILIS